MGFLSNWYAKEGPGVEKDAPQKKGIARFFEIVARDLSMIWSLAGLTFLCIVPSILSAIFFVFAFPYALLMAIGVVAYVLSSLLVGPALCGLHAVIISRVRDIPCFMMHEYKKAWKNNIRQSMPAGVIFMLLLGIELFVSYQLISLGGATSSLMLGIVFLSMLIIGSSAHLTILQIIFIDLPLFTIVINSLIISLANLIKMFGSTLITVIVLGAMALFWIFWPIYVLLGIVGFLAVIINMITWPIMDNTFNITQAQKEKKQKEQRED